MATIKQAQAALRKKLTAGKRYFAFLLLSAFFMLHTALPAYAANIRSSPIVTGTERLISDLTTWLMVLAPVVAGLLIIYFCIRRSAADEMDTKQWNNRIVVAVVSCIGAILGSATLNLIISYYK